MLGGAQRIRYGIAILAASCVLQLRPLRAAENPLKVIPADVTILARLKAPTPTIKKIVAITGQVQPEFVSVIKGASLGIGSLISNPALAGVDLSRDWWMAVYVIPNAEPSILFAIPATNLEMMQAAVNDGELTFFQHEKWGIYTANQDLAGKVKMLLAGNGKSADSLMEDRSRRVFDDGDLSLFSDARQLAKFYEGSLQQARQGIKNMFANAPVGDVNAFDAIGDLYINSFDAVHRAVKDATTLTVTLTIHDDALSAQCLATVASDSPSEKLIQRFVPTELKLIDQLPNGKDVYLQTGKGLARLQQWQYQLFGMMNDDDATVENLNKPLQDIANLKHEALGFTFDIGDSGLRTTMVTDIDQPQKFREALEKIHNALSGFNAMGFSARYETKRDAEKIDEHSIDHVNFVPGGAPEALIQMNDMFFGVEGQLTRSTFLKDRVVQTTGGGKEAMTEILKSLQRKPVPGQNPALSKVREHLSTKANLIVCADIPSVVTKFALLLGDSGLFPFDEETFGSVPKESSYVGLSLTAESQTVLLQVALPVEQARGLFRLFAATTR